MVKKARSKKEPVPRPEGLLKNGGEGLTADEQALLLALLSVDVWHAVDPQKIVLGGGMAQAGDILLNSVRKHFQQLCWHLQGAGGIEIVLSKLGNQAGIIGAASAAALAFSR